MSPHNNWDWSSNYKSHQCTEVTLTIGWSNVPEILNKSIQLYRKFYKPLKTKNMSNFTAFVYSRSYSGMGYWGGREGGREGGRGKAGVKCPWKFRKVGRIFHVNLDGHKFSLQVIYFGVQLSFFAKLQLTVGENSANRRYMRYYCIKVPCTR